MRLHRIAVALAAGILAAASTVSAVDGVVEINQARAAAGGVTAGDEEGFPVTISVPGSYRLTSDLTLPLVAGVENLTAIEITSDFVTLDLNGFALVGETNCTGTPVTSCSPVGSGDGIQASSRSFVRIHNGTVRGFGDKGIHAGYALIEDVRARSNGSNGIHLELGGRVTGSAAIGNGAHGFTGQALTVERSRASLNKGAGFDALSGVVRASEAFDNVLEGIRVGDGLAFDNLSWNFNEARALSLSTGGYARNILVGEHPPVTGGTQIGPNSCNGGLCP
jgi:hypothetical protein